MVSKAETTSMVECEVIDKERRMIESHVTKSRREAGGKIKSVHGDLEMDEFTREV